MQHIGNLDKHKLGKYKDKITTQKVILTDERKLHIYENHYNDFETIMQNMKETILAPFEILEDIKNKDTIFLIGKLRKSQSKCYC